MKISFTFLLLISVCKFSYCQSSEEIIKNFFEAYKNKNIDKAIDVLFGDGIDSHEMRDRVRLQLKRHIRNDGEYFGADLVTTKTAGTNVVMYTYTVRHMLEPLTFRIMLYKPNDNWRLESLNIYNNLATELEDQSKGYRIVENNALEKNTAYKNN